jgi:hypothetical protein
MEYKKYKLPKKSRLKIYKKYEAKIYSCTCPRCHTEFIGGIDDNVLMMECQQCHSPIDLRDSNGKQNRE